MNARATPHGATVGVVRTGRGWVLVVCLLTALVSSRAERARDDQRVATKAIPDAVVVTQEGRTRRFKPDILAGRIAIICFFYVDCRFICMPQGRVFGHVAKALGDRMGRDVVLVSISLAPEEDEVTDLKAWADHFEPVPDWFLLTGRPGEIGPLVKSLAAEVGPRNSHDAVALILDEATGTLHRTYGFDDPKNFVATIDRILAAKAALKEQRSAVKAP